MVFIIYWIEINIKRKVDSMKHQVDSCSRFAMDVYMCTFIAPVQVSDGDDLSSDIVVQSVKRAGVDEAVSHPNPRLHHLRDLPQHLGSRKKQERHKQ